MIHFDRPWLLILAVLLPIAAAAMVLMAHRRRTARLARLGSDSVVQRLLPESSRRSPWWRALTLGIAAGLAGIAFAGPRWGTEPTIVRGEGIDMLLVLDASLSMMADDVRPNRLEQMKQEVRRLRAAAPGHRFGVIAFAGRSYILTPLTVDARAMDLYIDNLEPAVVGTAGSNLSRAIRQATALLASTTTGSDRAMVIMSDGEMFESEEDIVAAARLARERGIAVVTVGFGSPEGSRIPVRTAGGVTHHRDPQGEVVVTRYVPDFLRAAANAANGTFIDAAETDKAGRIRAAVATLRTERRADVAGEERTPRFQLFLAPALLLLLLDTWRSERRSRSKKTAAAATRPAVAAGLTLLVMLPLAGCDGPAEKGAQAYGAERYAEAAAHFREAIARGDRSERAMYDLGTALVSADSFQQSAEVLEQLRQSQDDELRYRALFNEGLAHLETGRATSGAPSEAALDQALARYRTALRMRSGEMDAKWNYELALRIRQEGGGGGGGGGADDPQPQPQPDPAGPPQQAPRGGSLGEQQAEQVLNAAARDEREVQARSQRRGPPPPPAGERDW